VIRLAVRAPAERAEEVLGAMIEMAPSGVEQVDGEGWVEFAVYGAPGELPELDPGEAEVAGVRVTVTGTEVADDWEERWKRFHEPILVGKRLYVRPPWMPPATEQAVCGEGKEALPGEGVIDLVIDPGRAFGTGSHATTRLCLELLLDVADEGGSAVDLGCGSGVLSIAAALLGLGPVTALDADPLAVDATLANAAANGVELNAVERGNLREQPAPAGDVVLANLMRPLLLRVAELMGDERPPVLIASGLLDHEADEISAAFAPLTERRRLSDKGWSALLLAV
jgi:ribosomal protein L11 methyltransferase